MVHPTARTSKSEQIETVIIGGGQAGLSLSYLLTDQGQDHVVLEKSERVGESWRHRWDSFTLVTPNWQMQLPGHHYDGDDPHGFMARDEVVTYLEAYAEAFNPPLRFGVEARSLEPVTDESGYVVQTSDGNYEAKNVVVATGTFQQPNIPPCNEHLPSSITQLHSSDYANPQELPDGAVLVVGSGQSGCQIAQELHEDGRRVFLCVGSARRLPRRYRGKDMMWWADKLGLFDETVDKLSSPEERFAANPQTSGKNGGTDINLHRFAHEGITLLGRLNDVQGTRVYPGNDLHQNLANADQMATEFRKGVDRYVEQAGLDLPQEEVDEPRDGFDQELIGELDLEQAGIKTVVWATGYRWDYGWVQLPIFDRYGYPKQQRGVTAYPGLYFLGLHFLHKRKSGLFYGIGDDARHVAAHIARQRDS